MHEVDETTEQMVRSVLAYAENRLRMNPVPLDKGVLPAEDVYRRLGGLIRDQGRNPAAKGVTPQSGMLNTKTR